MKIGNEIGLQEDHERWDSVAENGHTSEAKDGHAAVAAGGTQYKETRERNQKETGDTRISRKGPESAASIIDRCFRPRKDSPAFVPAVPTRQGSNGRYLTASEIEGILRREFSRMGAKLNFTFGWPRQKTTEKHCRDLAAWLVSREEIAAALDSLARKYSTERDKLRVIQATKLKRFSPGAELKDKMLFLRGRRCKQVETANAALTARRVAMQGAGANWQL